MNLVSHISSACNKLGFAEDITQEYVALWSKLEAFGYEPFFANWLNNYESDYNTNLMPALSDLQKIADKEKIHVNQLNLIFYLILADALQTHYEKAGLSEQIYLDSISDLKWKMFFSHKMTGIYGIHTAPWETNFFNFSVYGIGRLEFEPAPVNPILYLQKGFPKNIKQVIKVHIPEAGRLLSEDVHKAYDDAANFFCNYIWHRAIDESPIVFTCDSWLLCPKHRAFLQPNSNIIRFMDDFTLVSEHPTDKELWRIFFKQYENNPEEMPEDTELQRGYKNLLLKGEHSGSGYGFFIYNK